MSNCTDCTTCLQTECDCPIKVGKCQCSSPELVNPPPLLVASSYIQFKKNYILYQQYKEKNPGVAVCNKKYSPNKIQYRSYQLKQSIERGCWYNELYCKCACPKLTCKS